MKADDVLAPSQSSSLDGSGNTMTSKIGPAGIGPRGVRKRGTPAFPS
jgi:hypothetical protein